MSSLDEQSDSSVPASKTKTKKTTKSRKTAKKKKAKAKTPDVPKTISATVAATKEEDNMVETAPKSPGGGDLPRNCRELPCSVLFAF